MTLTTASHTVCGTAPPRLSEWSKLVAAAATIAGLFAPSVALAQEDEATPAPAPTTAEAEAEADADAEVLMASPAPAPAPAPAGSFSDKFDYQLMASGYYLFSSQRLSGPDADTSGYNAVGYPYTQFPGFGLNFVGADLSFSDGDFGAVINLRWGNGAPLLTPLAPIKQGYVSWSPGSWTLDVGFFDTIYGAEVADEWQNVTFSRGALYFLRQPFNHLGVRLGGEVAPGVGLTFLVANGDVGATALPAGEFEKLNVTPSVGAQVNYSPSDSLSVILGYLTGPNGTEGVSDFNSNGDFGHFFDLVVNFASGPLTLVANADVTIDSGVAADTVILYGGMLAASVAVSDQVSVGGRVEYLGDKNAGEVYLVTGTGTVRYKANKYLTFSFEPRVEISDEPLFFTRDDMGPGGIGLTDDPWFGAIVGVSGVIPE